MTNYQRLVYDWSAGKQKITKTEVDGLDLEEFTKQLSSVPDSLAYTKQVPQLEGTIQSVKRGINYLSEAAGLVPEKTLIFGDAIKKLYGAKETYQERLRSKRPNVTVKLGKSPG